MTGAHTYKSKVVAGSISANHDGIESNCWAILFENNGSGTVKIYPSQGTYYRELAAGESFTYGGGDKEVEETTVFKAVIEASTLYIERTYLEKIC